MGHQDTETSPLCQGQVTQGVRVIGPYMRSSNKDSESLVNGEKRLPRGEVCDVAPEGKVGGTPVGRREKVLGEVRWDRRLNTQLGRQRVRVPCC